MLSNKSYKKEIRLSTQYAVILLLAIFSFSSNLSSEAQNVPSDNIELIQNSHSEAGTYSIDFSEDNFLSATTRTLSLSPYYIFKLSSSYEALIFTQFKCNSGTEIHNKPSECLHRRMAFMQSSNEDADDHQVT